MEKKNNLLIQILLLIPCFAAAQYAHIPVFSELENEELYEAVVEAYKPDSVLTYGMARDTMFSKIDAVNDSLECVYTGMKLYLTPGEDPTQVVYMNGIANGINTEHSYPQSKGAADGNARSDMHHLYPSRTKTNNDRGSVIYDESNDAQTSIWYRDKVEQSSIPSNSIDDYSELGNNLFEPRESYKGNIARSLMYFYTMYRDQADNADPEYFALQKETLCDWHYADPVDQTEWERSQKIAFYQDGKANPFVLDCSLAARMYCGELSTECMTVDIKEDLLETVNIYPNPARDILYMEGVQDEFIKISSVSGASKFYILKNEKIDISNLRKGIYYITIEMKGKSYTKRFVKL